MKRNLILILAFSCLGRMLAQPCFPEGIVFKTQEEINQFPIDNPTCSIIEGNLRIDGYFINDLSPLSNIIEIKGDFTHYANAYLYDFSGMEKLEKVGGTFRVANTKIESFKGLENLDSIGGNFELVLNNASITLDGFESLVYLGGSLILGGQNWEGNPYLGDISGLSTLEYIGGDFQLMGNEWLKDLNGLEKIDSIFGNITIGYDYTGENLALESLKGLNNLNYVKGDLTIASCPEFHDLSALASLIAIKGKLTFDRLDGVKDLAGINKLEKLGGLSIQLLPKIKSLDGLELIDSLPLGLNLSLLDSLDSVSGLSGLRYVGDDLELEDLYALKYVEGLNQLNRVEGNVYVEYNNILENLHGFENLQFIGGELSLYKNPKIGNLTDLNKLKQIGNELYVSRMNGLKNLEGMDELELIGGLSLWYNDSLESLAGLENLQTEAAYIYINSNTVLANITAIQQLDPNSIAYLSIKENPLLSECAINSICDYLTLANANIIIENNMEGCMSENEVESQCQALSNQLTVLNEIEIWPNPTADYIHIKLPKFYSNLTIKLYTSFGVLSGIWDIEKDKIYVGDQADGLYYLIFESPDGGPVARKIKVSKIN